MNRSIAVAWGLATSLAAPLAAAEVTFYSQEGLYGRAFTVSGTVENLDQTGFNDRASLMYGTISNRLSPAHHTHTAAPKRSSC